ncbi:flagellar hook-basal body protein [Tumebacillus lipolyticus]|uniref:Flagellar hook-basal body protein n=1 Tax=Tumebacillus lipolyticus TaxID=1280370 RepID=A0ABW4ZY09_9BACL
MIRGLYIANSGMHANERMQEIISNNIANANTVGYKSDTGIVRSFPEELILRINDWQGGVGAQNKVLGEMSTGTFLEETLPRFMPGVLQKSSNKNAYAILDNLPPVNEPNRRSYFPVLNGNQTMYTRDGDFKTQVGTNFLVTSSGDPVLPIDGRTGLPINDARIRVQANGDYQYVTAAGAAYPPGQANPQLGTVDIIDSTKLEKYGDTYFTSAAAPVRGTGQLERGQLEQSNVDLPGAMVSMINVMRSYEANQRMIKALDGTLEKAVSVGRLG